MKLFPIIAFALVALLPSCHTMQPQERLEEIEVEADQIRATIKAGILAVISGLLKPCTPTIPCPKEA